MRRFLVPVVLLVVAGGACQSQVVAQELAYQDDEPECFASESTMSSHSLLQATIGVTRRAAQMQREEEEQAPWWRSALDEAAVLLVQEGRLDALAAQVHKGGGPFTCNRTSECGWHAHCTEKGFCKACSLGERPRFDAAVGATAFVIAAFSLVAGVGGGGLFVPLVMGGLSLDARMATALSQSMLFGGALAAFAYNTQQTRPGRPQKMLVDFELACLLGSALMAGGQVGSVLHALFPPALLLALLTGVLVDSARKSLRSARRMAEKEGGEARQARREEVADLNQDEALREGLPSGALELVTLWGTLVLIVLFKGLVLEMCSPAWSLTTLGAVCLLGGFAWHFAAKLSVQTPQHKDDIDFRECAQPLARFAFLAGILAALCGIGGGMVIGPVLVERRVHPQVSSATTATTLLVLSSSTGLVYWCRGMAPMDYSLCLSLVTMSGALAGKVVIGWWVNRTGRQSLIVWCMLLITVLSALLMGVLGLLRIRSLGLKAFQFRNFCDVDGH